MWRFCVIGLLACASVAAAATVDHAGTYIGWGGEGGQVFRHKVSFLKNHQYSDRTLLLMVDDLPRRGARFGIARVTVEYTGGSDASKRLLSAIHQKPYTYVLVRMYNVPQSPRIARVVLPQAKGVKATLRFYHTVQRSITGENNKGLVAELTRTLDCDMLRELPVVHPMKDPTVRKPRAGQEVAVEPPREMEEAVVDAPEEPAPSPSPAASPAAPALPSPPVKTLSNLPPPPEATLPSGAPLRSAYEPVTPAAVDPDDPRVEATRQWAKRVAAELRAKQADEAEARRRGGGRRSAAPSPPGPGIGIEGAPSDRMGLDYEEDTPEMLEAERRAERLQAAGIVEPSETALQ